MAEQEKGLQIGDPITFVDSYGRDRPALVTHVGIPGKDDTWVNLVIVADDSAKHDTYGRQIERFSSVVSQKNQTAPGMYWKPLAA